jgi:hypothetical protein
MDDKYIDIDKLLVRQFKEQLELEKRLKRQDEDEQLDKKENRKSCVKVEPYLLEAKDDYQN